MNWYRRHKRAINAATLVLAFLAGMFGAHAGRANASSACTTPTPTTASGFAALWAKLPAAQWGSADVSISVKLPDGRVVWLYGDTISGDWHKPNMVHASAITQTRGCLHVSNSGMELIPRDDQTHYYWIDSAAALTGDWAGWLHIQTRRIHQYGPGPWDWADVGGRMAYAHVDDLGNVAFMGWSGPTDTSPPPDPGGLYACPTDTANPHHFCYARHPHPEFTVSGKTLWTEAQNYDDGIPHPFWMTRPIFHAGSF